MVALVIRSGPHQHIGAVPGLRAPATSQAGQDEGHQRRNKAGVGLHRPREPEPEVYTFGDRPLWPDAIVDRCRNALSSFKQYTRGVACSTAGHALAVVRSLYPSVRLDVIDGGYARGVSDAQITALNEEVEESAMRLADDLDMFGEQDNREQ